MCLAVVFDLDPFLKSLIKRCMINSLSNVLTACLYRLAYIKSYRLLFQLSNSEKSLLYGNIHTSYLTCKHRSHDLWLVMVDIKQDWINLLLKDHKYENTGACFGRINNDIGCRIMYFIVLGSESVPTNKFGWYDSGALNSGSEIRRLDIWPNRCPNKCPADASTDAWQVAK